MRRAVGLAVSGALLAVSVHAATLRVPEDYPNVILGVDAAAPGDSVLIGPGVWSESVSRSVLYFGSYQNIVGAIFTKPGLTLIGVGGPEEVVVQGVPGPTSATIVHANDRAEAVRVEGITFTGGGAGVAAASARGSATAGLIEFVNCRFEGNATSAVRCRLARVTLEDCVISDNANAPAVNGTDSFLQLAGCTLASNGDAAVKLSNLSAGASFRMANCVVRDHPVGAVQLRYVGVVEIENSAFVRNRASLNGGGGAVHMSSVGGGAVRFCTFAFDSSGSGGGLSLGSSPVAVENNTFFGCHGEIAGSALAVGGSDPGVRNNIFAQCTGPRGAVRRTVGANAGATGCNLFWSNETDYFGTWTQSGTDLVGVDPQFCDVTDNDFHVAASSTCLPENNFSECTEVIGAFGAGCPSTGVYPVGFRTTPDDLPVIVTARFARRRGSRRGRSDPCTRSVCRHHRSSRFPERATRSSRGRTVGRRRTRSRWRTRSGSSPRRSWPSTTWPPRPRRAARPARPRG